MSGQAARCSTEQCVRILTAVRPKLNPADLRGVWLQASYCLLVLLMAQLSSLSRAPGSRERLKAKSKMEIELSGERAQRGRNGQPSFGSCRNGVWRIGLLQPPASRDGAMDRGATPSLSHSLARHSVRCLVQNDAVGSEPFSWHNVRVRRNTSQLMRGVTAQSKCSPNCPGPSDAWDVFRFGQSHPRLGWIDAAIGAGFPPR